MTIDLGFISTEMVDILLHPLQGCDLVMDTKVQGSAVVGYWTAVRLRGWLYFVEKRPNHTHLLGLEENPRRPSGS